jgi:GR25 family glycosyltransferase involved in LPS biosynthesis
MQSHDFPVDVYCLSYQNPKRRKTMTEKFEKLEWPVEFYDGVGPEDPRMKEYEFSSCMLGHMDMIHKFYYESTKEFGIFCEDDVCIHDELAKSLPAIIEECKSKDLELVLLGYLMNYHIEYEGMFGHHSASDKQINGCHKLYTYGDQIWGTQMYMISRKYAKYLLETYSLEIGKDMLTHPEKYPGLYYAADWIITKKTKKRALLFPLFCIENGEVEHLTERHGQREFHRLSYTKHVNEHFV